MPTKTSVPGSPGPPCRRSANPTPLKKLSHPDKLVRGYRVGLGGLRDVVGTMGSGCLRCLQPSNLGGSSPSNWTLTHTQKKPIVRGARFAHQPIWSEGSNTVCRLRSQEHSLS